MKRFILIAALVAGTVAAQAQTTAAQPVVNKEEKAQRKAQQEQELADAFKAAGLSEAQGASVRAVLDSAARSNKELKTNTTLTEEQRAEAKKKINEDKNKRLKEIMGAEAYRQWNEARKAQRAKAGTEGNQ